MKLSSTAFKEGETIPRRYTCDGDNFSPPLAWEGAPPQAKSVAMIMDDPDAPSGTFVHWVLYDIPPAFSELREGVKGFGVLGSNSYRKVGYKGPCPPHGPAHRYYFKVYALDQLLKLHPGATKSDVERAMQGHILEQAQLMGKYGR